jgi:hypothetical protein
MAVRIRYDTIRETVTLNSMNALVKSGNPIGLCSGAPPFTPDLIPAYDACGVASSSLPWQWSPVFGDIPSDHVRAVGA